MPTVAHPNFPNQHVVVSASALASWNALGWVNIADDAGTVTPGSTVINIADVTGLQAALDAKSAVTARGITGGRPVVSLQMPRNIAYLTGTGTFQAGYKTAHTLAAAVTDLRLLYAPPFAAEVVQSNAQFMEAWIQIGAATPVQVSFGGIRRGRLEAGGTLMSDPFPADLAAGTTFNVYTWAVSEFGTATTLSAASSIGATSLSITAAPAITPTLPFDLIVDAGANKEIVRVTAISGTTLTIDAATKAHASGVAVGQEISGNYQVLADRGDAVLGTRSQAVAGTSNSLGTASTVLTAASSIGDDRVVANSLVLPSNQQVTVDTAGNAETATVKNVLGTGIPFTYVFTAPLTKAHASGVTMTSTAGSSAGLAPYVLADTFPATLKPILAVGDSIVSGQGYTGRTAISYLTLACEAANRPVIMISKGGENGSTFATLATSVLRRRLISAQPPGSWAWLAYGTNDVFAAQTLSAVQTTLLSIIASLKARGLKVAVATLTPRTNSTDLFATTTNQTSQSSSAETVRLAVNAWILAGCGGQADRVVDLAATVDSGLMAGGAASGLWGVGTGGHQLTIDGTHPSQVGHSLMSAAVTTALASMT